ncbi:hypothetical protein KY284_002559 [Solanum tuberosum]|nr:hypothetical protein KY284_002559 [Solanum tuberosum]
MSRYSKREVHNLARFISVMKFPPLSWRMSHPYIVVDRFEDLTPPEKVCMDNKCDRNVILYGYLRGCIEAKVRAPCKVHIAGVGDYSLAGITALPDPCPLPSAAKKKGLRDKEKLFYSPMSGFGDLLYDNYVVYTIINDHFVQFSKVDETAAVGSRRGYLLLFELVSSSKPLASESKGFAFWVELVAPGLPSAVYLSYVMRSFGKIHNPSSSNHAKADQTNDLVPAERDQSVFEPNSDGSDEDNDSEDLNELEPVQLKCTHPKESKDTSDDSSEKEDTIGSEKHSGSSSSFMEHGDFHDGRMRRKAIFDNDNDFDEKVSH